MRTVDSFDLISVGDSTIDTFIKIHDASVVCDINRRNCKISFPYGGKIPVDAIDHGVAGNAANVVIGGAKLGLKSAIYTNLGDDDQGAHIKDAFKKAGVAEDYVIVNKNKQSNLSVVLTFQGERTIFVYHQDWYYQLPSLASCKWLYLTSMAETFTNSNVIDDVCHYLDRTRAKLVFSPGTFQIKADVKRYPRLLEKCDVIIVNLEEAKKILGADERDTTGVHEILEQLLLLGPKVIVVTDGAEGSYATDGQRFLKAGIIPTQVSEKTGAGDAYSAAFLAALFQNEDIAEAMIWGTLNSSAVISRISTQSGQLTKGEILEKRKKLTGFSVTEL